MLMCTGQAQSSCGEQDHSVVSSIPNAAFVATSHLLSRSKPSPEKSCRLNLSMQQSSSLQILPKQAFLYPPEICRASAAQKGPFSALLEGLAISPTTFAKCRVLKSSLAAFTRVLRRPLETARLTRHVGANQYCRLLNFLSASARRSTSWRRAW
jgi:hypothetical protein